MQKKRNFYEDNDISIYILRKKETEKYKYINIIYFINKKIKIQTSIHVKPLKTKANSEISSSHNCLNSK